MVSRWPRRWPDGAAARRKDPLMTPAAVEALRADREALSTLAQSFSDDGWATPSRCEGWTVRDLLAHMTQLFRQVVDPASLPPGHPSGSVERTQDVWVAALRDVPVQQVLDDYRALGEKAIAALAGLQGNDTPLDLGELGTHPIHLVANAFAFDHYTHIRVDLLAPTGPLDRPAPPADEPQLTAVTDWIVAGLPQMSPAAAAEPVELVLTGPGGRTLRYRTGPPAPAEGG